VVLDVSFFFLKEILDWQKKVQKIPKIPFSSATSSSSTQQRFQLAAGLRLACSFLSQVMH